MILAVDIGNTRTTLALFTIEGQPVFLSELETDRRMTQDQCAIRILGVFQLYQARVEQVNGAILSSVVPPATQPYAQAIRRLTGQLPLLVGPGLKTGLNIRADVHNELGSDMVASAVAAVARYPMPAIVINSHTAVSFSYVSPSAFEGCAIMPGMGIALEALSQNGAQLPQISMGRVDSPLGRNTVDAMRAGIVYGYAGAFDRLIFTLEAAAGIPAATVVATGEHLPEIFRHCQREITYDHDLLAHGLYLLYRKNAPKGRGR
ncbi:MAG TPA: type III pantothenate kinase [Candidatus Enterenecus merdae]|nr:type III pantothenate kinase [Candidatus Enterenecus merdae]